MVRVQRTHNTHVLYSETDGEHIPEETPAFQEAIILFVLIQRSNACLCHSGRTSALHELIHGC